MIVHICMHHVMQCSRGPEEGVPAPEIHSQPVRHHAGAVHLPLSRLEVSEAVVMCMCPCFSRSCQAARRNWYSHSAPSSPKWSTLPGLAGHGMADSKCLGNGQIPGGYLGPHQSGAQCPAAIALFPQGPPPSLLVGRRQSGRLRCQVSLTKV